jgi:hypothetical protein
VDVDADVDEEEAAGMDGGHELSTSSFEGGRGPGGDRPERIQRIQEFAHLSHEMRALLVDCV